MSKPAHLLLFAVVSLFLFGLFALPGLANEQAKSLLTSNYSPQTDMNLIPSGQITFTPVATIFLPLIQKSTTPMPGTTATATATELPTPTATATATKFPTLTATATPTATGSPIKDVTVIFIEYNPPGLDSDGEFVDIRNNESSAVNMTDWTLRDEANTVFTFPNFSLGAQSTVRVWVRNGIDDANNLYWGRNSATWNNDGDTAILRNSEGVEVDRCNYVGNGENTSC